MSKPNHISESLEEVMARCNQAAEAGRRFRLALEAWAGDKPQSVVCPLHREVRPVNWDRSVILSHEAGENKLAYVPCPKCVETRKLAEKSVWLRRAGVPDNLCHATLANFIARTDEDKANFELVEKFTRSRRGLLALLGDDYGNGKSHLAVAVLREAGSGYFVTNNNLLAKLRDTYRDRRAEDIVQRCKRAKLFCLDEIGLSAGGKDELPMIHDILSHRHGEKMRTIITGNVTSLEQFQTMIGGRMADRLKESGFKLLWFKGESMRPQMKQQYFDGDGEDERD